MMAASMINTDFIQKHPAQAVLTVLGLSGVVLLFLPFFDGEVPAVGFLDLLPPPLPPFGSFDELFWWLAPAVLFPFAISAGYLRWLLTGNMPSMMKPMWLTELKATSRFISRWTRQTIAP